MHIPDATYAPSSPQVARQPSNSGTFLMPPSASVPTVLMTPRSVLVTPRVSTAEFGTPRPPLMTPRSAAPELPPQLSVFSAVSVAPSRLSMGSVAPPKVHNAPLLNLVETITYRDLQDLGYLPPSESVPQLPVPPDPELGPTMPLVTPRKSEPEPPAVPLAARRPPVIPRFAPNPTYQQMYIFRGANLDVSPEVSPTFSMDAGLVVEEPLAPPPRAPVRVLRRVRDIGIQTFYYARRTPGASSHMTWRCSVGIGSYYGLPRARSVRTRDMGTQVDFLNESLRAEREQAIEAEKQKASSPRLAQDNNDPEYPFGALPPPFYMDNIPELSYAVPDEVALFFSGTRQSPRASPRGTRHSPRGGLYSPRGGGHRLGTYGDEDPTVYMGDTLEHSLPSRGSIHYWGRDMRLPSLDKGGSKVRPEADASLQMPWVKSYPLYASN